MTESTNYKVWVKAVGESTWATNGLEFETSAEADAWGYDLLMRWFGAEEYTVLKADPKFTGHLDAYTIKANAIRSQS